MLQNATYAATPSQSQLRWASFQTLHMSGLWAHRRHPEAEPCLCECGKLGGCQAAFLVRRAYISCPFAQTPVAPPAPGDRCVPPALLVPARAPQSASQSAALQMHPLALARNAVFSIDLKIQNSQEHCISMHISGLISRCMSAHRSRLTSCCRKVSPSGWSGGSALRLFKRHFFHSGRLLST